MPFLLTASALARTHALKVPTLLLLVITVTHQIYYAFRIDLSRPSAEMFIEPLPSTKPSFAACLLVKDDNDLLPEWLAYHYTVLPLRHVVVGVDVNSTQDPLQILERWRHTDLRYTLLPAEAFVDRYPAPPPPTTSSRTSPSTKGFLSVCSEYLQREGARWTAYIDTDEYVIPNRLSRHDEDFVLDGRGHDSMKNVSFQIRKHLPSVGDSSATVADVLIQLQKVGFVESCYTLPRLLVGALENRTCDNAQNDKQQLPKLSTLRYFQHAVKGDFQMSKFASTIESTVPRSIHRPYKDNCGPGSVHFPDAFFYTNHYVGSWERYSSRSDKRRNRNEWEKRAFLDDGTPACESTVYEWLPRFIGQVGEVQATYLLNGSNG